MSDPIEDIARDFSPDFTAEVVLERERLARSVARRQAFAEAIAGAKHRHRFSDQPDRDKWKRYIEWLEERANKDAPND